MGKGKTVNFKSPVTWIILCFCLAVGIGVGTYGDWLIGGELQEAQERQPPQELIKGLGEAAAKQLSKAAPTKWLKGEGFTIPIPDGFHVPPEKIAGKARKMGGVIIMVDRPEGEMFRGAVVVIPVEKTADMESLSYLDDHSKACAELNLVPLEKSKTQVIKVPSGTYCQRIGLVPDRESVASTLTLFKPVGVEAAWSVTCNYDPRDTIAQSGCVQVLEHWRYEEAPQPVESESD